MKVQDEINLHNQEKKTVSAKSNGSGPTNLVGTTSSISFTWPTTFGRREIYLKPTFTMQNLKTNA
jgi:hypothetical protein